MVIFSPKQVLTGEDSKVITGLKRMVTLQALLVVFPQEFETTQVYDPA
jgi:hypothetical protein